MNLFFYVHDTLSRGLERKKTLAALAAVYLAGVVLGILFFKTPAVYGYHLRLCEKYLVRVCYADRSLFLVFLERTAGCVLLVAVMTFSGIHIVGLVLPPPALVYRAYTFGGSIAVLFSVYRMSGALIVFTLYLPVRLLTDAVLLLAASLSFGRARRFRFCRQDGAELLIDFAVLAALAMAVCLLEMLLLAAIVHPIGNLL